MVSADMIADNPGTWLFHCQVSDHLEAGMLATYTICDPETRAWLSNKPVAPGQTEGLTSKIFLPGSGALLGWSFCP
jgi:hypothetical protein